jgi:hypothetical protein
MARARNAYLDAEPPRRAPGRCCDQPGCESEALFRAPRSRDHLGDLQTYHWFCLEHVRLYNAAWNYYAGMNDAEIERELRLDLVGHRPTWPLGWRTAGGRWRDPLSVFAEEAEPAAARRRKAPPDEMQALIVFDLEPPFSIETLKARYKVLVKRHHPDTNGGSKDSEERLKVITRAYALLKSRYFG